MVVWWLFFCVVVFCFSLVVLVVDLFGCCLVLLYCVWWCECGMSCCFIFWYVRFCWEILELRNVFVDVLVVLCGSWWVCVILCGMLCWGCIGYVGLVVGSWFVVLLWVLCGVGCCCCWGGSIGFVLDGLVGWVVGWVFV